MLKHWVPSPVPHKTGHNEAYLGSQDSEGGGRRVTLGYTEFKTNLSCKYTVKKKIPLIYAINTCLKVGKRGLERGSGGKNMAALPENTGSSPRT